MSVLFICFFNDTETTEIYTYLHTLSRHDALPIEMVGANLLDQGGNAASGGLGIAGDTHNRNQAHTIGSAEIPKGIMGSHHDALFSRDRCELLVDRKSTRLNSSN